MIAVAAAIVLFICWVMLYHIDQIFIGIEDGEVGICPPPQKKKNGKNIRGGANIV